MSFSCANCFGERVRLSELAEPDIDIDLDYSESELQSELPDEPERDPDSDGSEHDPELSEYAAFVRTVDACIGSEISGACFWERRLSRVSALLCASLFCSPGDEYLDLF